MILRFRGSGFPAGAQIIANNGKSSGKKKAGNHTGIGYDIIRWQHKLLQGPTCKLKCF